MVKTRWRIGSVITAMLAIGLISFLLISRRNYTNRNLQIGGAPAILPTIVPPTGWQTEYVSSSTITLSRETEASATPATISVVASSISEPLQNFIEDYLGYYPFVADPSQRWATINGHLVLVANDWASNIGTTLDYFVFANGTEYIFSLDPYEYNHVVQNLGDVQMIQTMVNNFAAALPS